MTKALPPEWAYIPELAAAQLPRYTSYPPANRFSSAIGDADAVRALQSIAPSETVSIYIHIPFCQQLCWYCGCNASVPTRANPLDPYVDALLQEFDLVGDVTGRRAVTQIHFGGGSPNVLTPEQIDALFGRLHERFDVSDDAEVSAEFDPRAVPQESLAAFAGGGLTRASLGVQVLDAHIQSLIHREQPTALIDDLVERLRNAGVDNINMDIMYGLPEQDVDHVLETASYAAAHAVDRIAAFGYAHVPWFKKHQSAIRTESLPPGKERFRQAEAVSRFLLSAGYEAIGFDHFARPDDSLSHAARTGRLRRNFQGYTADNADHLLGFGASAISSTSDHHLQNTPDPAQYRQKIESGRLATTRGARLADADRHIAKAISDLLCFHTTCLGDDTAFINMDRLHDLKSMGLVTFDGRNITVTLQGRPYARNIAAALDPGFKDTPARHSLAV